ncbi:CpsD/CapB family tyrosine-protein kinase [Enterococcus raffinosus]|uniref:Tyrosine-protein kinase CpsD n=1 Tax=Enterococcus raffinosus TaxID=71452 RepID=A0AAW8SWV3_9ENTE|nr:MULTISPECIES: CpsD/CapB family tyrosine-protein kinase [Enterococcus]MBS6430340.1 CpsD/CapB family tyrosine-protein kinase [Enterococcus raffinosus]MDK7989158.1 CpsD/CapB family tyrosine-protein kinase [Enterococcus raffinosus]MDT2536727.1 CpsD/CapB family tyrosine-protein kinase [Enterococcus raffinosus]MDT2570600.1 CpsD/CapB family tyrosine-protein kinase [Enterococcus raffinosus]OFT87406.1 tyrosine protein kinase [Enterococcus sp. HMSC29A04]
MKVRETRLISIENRFSPITEQYRNVRTSIQFAASAGDPLKLLLVTSTEQEEGKTTLAANLAVVMSETNKKILLIDGDLRRATAGKYFNMRSSQAVGLSTLLNNGRSSLNEAIQRTQVKNLDFLPAGPIPPNPSELLNSLRLNELFSELEDQYDAIIVDSPPLLVVTDAQIFSSKVDGVILVVRENRTKRNNLIKCKTLLERSKAHLIGVVYNGAKSMGAGNYKYYKY